MQRNNTPRHLDTSRNCTFRKRVSAVSATRPCNFILIPNSFRLSPGDNHTLHVSQDWQGRIWGRTNCSFNDAGESTGDGRQCSTGDCGPFLQCKGAGENPATLAEFTLSGAHDQSYYDISLVDGYNLPVAIVLLANSRSDVEDIPPNQTNPSCIGSVGDLGPTNHDPYANNQIFLGTNGSSPLPFNRLRLASLAMVSLGPASLATARPR
jgi:hypothetical protein